MFFPSLGFTSSVASLFGFNNLDTVSHVSIAIALEILRIALLTLSSIGINILNAPSQYVLPTERNSAARSAINGPSNKVPDVKIRQGQGQDSQLENCEPPPRYERLDDSMNLPRHILNAPSQDQESQFENCGEPPRYEDLIAESK